MAIGRDVIMAIAAMTATSKVTAIAPWGGKGELTVLGSKGPTFFFIVLCLITMSLFY